MKHRPRDLWAITMCIRIDHINDIHGIPDKLRDDFVMVLVNTKHAHVC